MKFWAWLSYLSLSGISVCVFVHSWVHVGECWVGGTGPKITPKKDLNKVTVCTTCYISQPSKNWLRIWLQFSILWIQPSSSECCQLKTVSEISGKNCTIDKDANGQRYQSSHWSSFSHFISVHHSRKAAVQSITKIMSAFHSGESVSAYQCCACWDARKKQAMW